MSSIINALFGHHKDKDEKKTTEKKETVAATTTMAAGSSSGSSVAHTAISDDVRVKSVVSTETNTSVSMQNTKKINDLMSKLGEISSLASIGKETFDLFLVRSIVGTTHNQIDEYSKKRNAEISDAVGAAIDKVVADTASEQQHLLADANQRSAAIELEHKQRLQERVAQLDTEKAVLLAELERELNARQEAILLKARENIDLVQNAGNQEKMAILKQAQAQANQQVDQITEQVAGLAAEDAQRRLQSTTQTVRLRCHRCRFSVYRISNPGHHNQSCRIW